MLCPVRESTSLTAIRNDLTESTANGIRDGHDTLTTSANGLADLSGQAIRRAHVLPHFRQSLCYHRPTLRVRTCITHDNVATRVVGVATDGWLKILAHDTTTEASNANGCMSLGVMHRGGDTLKRDQFVDEPALTGCSQVHCHVDMRKTQLRRLVFHCWSKKKKRSEYAGSHLPPILTLEKTFLVSLVP